MARGRKTGGGSRKGRPNKVTTALKDAVLRAFEKVGGEDYLVTVAGSDPRTFCALLGRVLPRDVRLEPEGEGRVEYVFRWAGEGEK
jgi:hypothetical protein